MLTFVADGGGDPLSVVERGPCSLELAGLGQRHAQAYVEPRESWVVSRKQCGRAVQEIQCREVVATIMSGTAGVLKVYGRPARQRT